MICIYSPDKAREIDYNKQIYIIKFEQAHEYREKNVSVIWEVSHSKQKGTKNSAEQRLCAVTGHLTSIPPYSCSIFYNF